MFLYLGPFVPEDFYPDLDSHDAEYNRKVRLAITTLDTTLLETVREALIEFQQYFDSSCGSPVFGRSIRMLKRMVEAYGQPHLDVLTRQIGDLEDNGMVKASRIPLQLLSLE